MTYCAPNSQGYNLTHMSSFVDQQLKKGLTVPEQYNKNSLYGKLRTNAGFKKFYSVVQRSGVSDRLDEPQANFTLLTVPDDKLIHIPNDYFTTMDRGLAFRIVKTMLLNRKLDKTIITSSPFSYYKNMNDQQLYITNTEYDTDPNSGTTSINKCATVLQFDVGADNGIIHVIDNILMPTNDHFLT